MCCVCMYTHTQTYILTHNGIITHLKKKKRTFAIHDTMDGSRGFHAR